jgi:hypothetical protein
VIDPALRAALTADLDATVSAPATRLAHHLADIFGTTTAAVLHYGSRSHTANPPPGSAYDFFVIVDDNASAYRSFTAHAAPRFGARTATLLAGILPPNIIGVHLAGEQPGDVLTGKCVVLSAGDLALACGQHAKDHFTKGRLIQPLRLAWVRDERSRRAIEDALFEARANTFEWARPDLPASFDTADFCRTLLSMSYAGEIRIEKATRAGEVFASQSALMLGMYDALLRKLAAGGELKANGDGYTQTRPASSAERMRVVWYFRRSKLRAMARWNKSLVLYDHWVEYLRQKAERRAGTAIELTPREKQWPLIFLWPRAIRLLMTTRR